MPFPRRLASQDAPLIALLALALLAKALVPAGFMPVLGNGTVMLRVCSGWVAVPNDHPAARLQALAAGHGQGDPADRDHGGSDGSSKGQPCGFFASAPVLPALPEVLLAPPFAAATPVLAPVLVTIGRGLAAPPPPAIGPPHQS